MRYLYRDRTPFDPGTIFCRPPDLTRSERSSPSQCLLTGRTDLPFEIPGKTLPERFLLLHHSRAEREVLYLARVVSIGGIESVGRLSHFPEAEASPLRHWDTVLRNSPARCWNSLYSRPKRWARAARVLATEFSLLLLNSCGESLEQ